MEMLQAGEEITVSKVQSIGIGSGTESAAPVRKLTKPMAAELLKELGYVQARDATELIPALGPDGEMVTKPAEPVWSPVQDSRILEKAEKSKLLASRLAKLSEAFVADALEDPRMDFASLKERAIEISRSVSMELGRALYARAKFGAEAILEDCATVSSATLKGSMGFAKKV